MTAMPRPSPPPQDLHEWFDHGRAELPERQSFLVAGDTTITYRAIDEHTGRFATFLDEHGVAADAAILVIANDPIVVGQLSLAVVRTGRTLCVIDPAGTAREIRSALLVVEPALVFAAADVIDRCDLGQDGTWTAIELAAPAPKNLASRLFAKRKEVAPASSWPLVVDECAPASTLPALDPDRCAVIVFTSGSTSSPKGVELSLRAILTHFETLTSVFDLDGAVVQNVLPLSHVDGLMEGPLLSYFTGATWIRPCDFSVAEIPELLDSVYRHRITHMFVVPTMLALYDRLATDMADAFETEEFRMIVSSAGPLPTALWERFEATFKTTVCNSYGLSETVTSSIASGPPASGTRCVGTIGKPIDCAVTLIDADGKPVENGETGEIVIEGPHLFSGYRGDPEATAAVLRAGRFHTGDLARRDGDGFLRLQGRKSAMVIRGGRNISPVEIDGVIGRLDGVVQSQTVGVDDEMWGQRVESLVVTAPTVTAEAVIEHCRNELAAYKVPQRVVLADSMPLTTSGKIDASAVQDLLTNRSTVAIADQAIDKVLLATAARVFGAPLDQLALSSSVDQVDGWDSLAHLALVGELEVHFDIEMSNADILGIRTLADAAEVVRSHSA